MQAGEKGEVTHWPQPPPQDKWEMMGVTGIEPPRAEGFAKVLACFPQALGPRDLPHSLGFQAPGYHEAPGSAKEFG